MFKFKSIRAKIIISLFSVFLLALSLHSIYQLGQIQRQAFEMLESVNRTINEVLVEFSSAYIYREDVKNIEHSINMISSEYIKSIYILDKNGKVIANKNGSRTSGEYDKFKLLLNAKDNRIANTKEYLTLNMVSILDVPIGYMVLEANLAPYHRQVDMQKKSYILEAFLLSILFLILSLSLANSLSLPIEKIVKRLQETKDDEILEFPAQMHAEFQYLGETISKSHNRLRTMKENLEYEVSKKTKELQELNTTLEQKIIESVAEVKSRGKMLEQQSRMAQMGEMISMIAHQWRQPLATIAAVAVNLRVMFELKRFDLEKEEERESCQEYIQKHLVQISGLVQSLTMTIDDFRTFYKPNKEKDLCVVNEAIKKGIYIIQTSLVHNHITLKEEYMSERRIPHYSNELMQVILNVIKNAEDNFIEMGIKEGKISVRSYDTLASTMIEIEDNGGGIPDTILDKIFDPYFSTKDEKNGTGLGLYMSKMIIEEHHKGMFYAKNTQEGVCFYIRFDWAAL